MIIDSSLQFSNNQAVTASAASATIVDTKQVVPQGVNTGIGVQLWLVVLCVAAMTDAGNDSTVTPSLRTSATQSAGALNGTINTLVTLPAFPATSPAGTMRAVQLPSGQYLEYLDVNFAVANGNLTTGSFSAFITTDIDANQAYPAGYQVA